MLKKIAGVVKSANLLNIDPAKLKNIYDIIGKELHQLKPILPGAASGAATGYLMSDPMDEEARSGNALRGALLGGTVGMGLGHAGAFGKRLYGAGVPPTPQGKSIAGVRNLSEMRARLGL